MFSACSCLLLLTTLYIQRPQMYISICKLYTVDSYFSGRHVALFVVMLNKRIGVNINNKSDEEPRF